MWIEMHDSARDHPKVLKLARVLGTSQVVTLGHVTSLWLWTLRMAPDGDLSSFDWEDIEIGAQWDGKPGKFVEACVAKKLLDIVDGTYRVHDWEDYSGSLKSADRKRKERERKAAYRAKKAEEAAAKLAPVEHQLSTSPAPGQAPKINQETIVVPGTSHGRPEKSACVTQNDRPTDQTDRPDRPSARSGTIPSEPADSVCDCEDDEQETASEEGGEPKTEPEPAVVTIPVAGGGEYHVTQKQVDEWTGAFPAVDVLQQVRTARQWCLANPTRRKTRKGVPKFIVGWLSREQDSSRIVPGTHAGRPHHVGYHQGSTKFGNGDQVL